jgi:hypothetical protein
MKSVEIHFFSLHRSLCSLPLVRLKPRSSHAHKKCFSLITKHARVCGCDKVGGRPTAHKSCNKCFPTANWSNTNCLIIS